MRAIVRLVGRGRYDMRRATQTLAIVASITIVGGLVAPAAAASARPVSSDAYEQRILDLVNLERTRRGLRPLRVARCADGFATRWSQRLAESESLRHQPMRRVLDGCEARRAAENIGHGAVSAERMVKLWMGSRRHRANLLDARFSRIGVGAARSRSGAWYAVTNFLAY